MSKLLNCDSDVKITASVFQSRTQIIVLGRIASVMYDLL